MREYEIVLENLCFYAHHGVYEHELRDGNEFNVCLKVGYPASRFTTDDNLQNTVSYVRLFEITKVEMTKPRKLLETVAHDISNKIKEEFPFISSIECKITKLSPPISGFIGSASVIYREKETETL